MDMSLEDKYQMIENKYLKNTINKIKKVTLVNNYGNITDTVDKNSINIYKQHFCSSLNLNTITISQSKYLDQINSYNTQNNRNKFNGGDR